MRSALLMAAAAAVALAACDGPSAPPATPAPAEAVPPPTWSAEAIPADASTLGRLAQAWRLARAEAEEAGFASQVEALGPLVDPNAGLAGELQPAPGDYRCRLVGLGARAPGDPAHVETSWGRCTVELTPGGDLWLTRDSEPGRYRGRLYPDSERRLVFLGVSADEAGAAAAQYGEVRRRDRIGVFERVGPARWRLVVPWPRDGSKLEIVELVR